MIEEIIYRFFGGRETRGPSSEVFTLVCTHLQHLSTSKTLALARKPQVSVLLAAASNLQQRTYQGNPSARTLRHRNPARATLPLVTKGGWRTPAEIGPTHAALTLDLIRVMPA